MTRIFTFSADDIPAREPFVNSIFLVEDKYYKVISKVNVGIGNWWNDEKLKLKKLTSHQVFKLDKSKVYKY